MHTKHKVVAQPTVGSMRTKHKGGAQPTVRAGGCITQLSNARASGLQLTVRAHVMREMQARRAGRARREN
eukprot:15442989-Alexandrium_andersonii.AAC.1